MNGFHLIIDHDMKRDISNKILQDRMETGPSKLAAYKKILINQNLIIYRTKQRRKEEPLQALIHSERYFKN